MSKEKGSILIYGKKLQGLEEVIEALKEDGINVTIEDGERCDLNIQNEFKPDLVLIDNDDSNNGLTLYKLIKDKGAADTIPVIFTGQADEKIKLEALKLGAVDFVQKPFLKEELIAKCKNLIALSTKNAAGESKAYIESSEMKDKSTKSLLIIDEDKVMLSVLSSRYKNKGYTVYSVENEASLDKVLQDNPIDLVITEFMLAGITGNELIKKLKNSNRGIKIIVLSAQKNENFIEMAFNTGADDYIAKPFSPIELDSRVRRLIEQ